MNDNLRSVRTANSTILRLKPIFMTKFTCMSSVVAGLRAAAAELRRGIAPPATAGAADPSLDGVCSSSSNWNGGEERKNGEKLNFVIA